MLLWYPAVAVRLQRAGQACCRGCRLPPQGGTAGCQLLTHTSKPFCITWDGSVLSPCSTLH